MDIYYKIVALSAIGKRVILHYFDYKEGRGIGDLAQYCYKIYRYKRQTGFTGLSFRLPYIVRSRINKVLINTLNKDRYPILLEGIHCTGILPYINNGSRKIVLRLHNNEATYYKALAQATKSAFKQMYYLRESFLLNTFQKSLPKEICIAGLSQSDLEDFHAQHFTNLHFVPSFIPWHEIRSKSGTGGYCLYQGNLSVSENEEAAVWLVDNIFSRNSIPFIIAGKAPSESLRKRTAGFANIEIVVNPTEEKMKVLVNNAQINILPSFNKTGVKLKLLNALFNGRYCITNPSGVEGSQIRSGVIIVDKKVMAEQVSHYFTKPFSKDEAALRQQLLEVYNNRYNAQKLSALIS